MTNDDLVRTIREYSRKTYREEEYPALAFQMREWGRTRPLAGLRILVGTPLYGNTLLQYVPLLAAGAELTAATHDGIPFDPEIVALLDQWGLRHVHNDTSGKYDCILDCGGVHAQLNPVYGYAELTRSGYYHYKNAQKPVILVDDSRIKAIETCLGTGDGFLRGMQAAGYTDLSGKKIALFGYGKVGRGIAYYSHKAGALLSVIDEPGLKFPDYVKSVDRHDRKSVAEAVSEAWCVVTATGIENAMVGNGAAEILKDSSRIIAAMGVENEWGDSLPSNRILNNGAPLNFILKEPTRFRYIDPSMALLNAAALELVRNRFPAGIRKIDPAIEAQYWSIVEKNGIIAQELEEAFA